MRKLLIVAAIALIGALPVTLPAGAQAQTQPKVQTEKPSDTNRLAAVGAGAIVAGNQQSSGCRFHAQGRKIISAGELDIRHNLGLAVDVHV